jgi:threonine dehydrogenase-like Zn-dependent dehydrogenase
MKAAVIVENGRLAVQEIPEPEAGPYDALVEILYGATCSGTDLALIAGELPFRSPLPTVLGHESVGRVVAVGDRVRYLSQGDVVTRVSTPPVGGYSVSWGGFAELGIAKDYRAMLEDGESLEPFPDARRNRVLPPSMDPAAGTMVITWRETLSYLTRMGVGPGDRLLVIGSGGNGLAYVAHGANLGAGPVVMVGAAERAGLARRAGATEVLDYRADDLAGQLAAAAGEGFDYVVDAVGKKGMADLALQVLKPGGTLGIYGLHDFGECTITPLDAGRTFTFYGGGYDEAETHERVMAFVARGKLDATIWIDPATHVYPLQRIHEAFDAVRRREVVKALISMQGDSAAGSQG